MPPSMFAGDVVITGGTFNQSVVPTQSSFGFDKLTQKASPRAFHQADSDLSHSTCFTNTRTNVLDRLKDWALRKSEKDKFIMWLHGAAGGGKTSIARTIARWCDEDEGILLGEFFFSRADGLANQFTTFAPTLAYRMAAHTCKETKKTICHAINQDPHIFSAPLAYQLKKLVLEPLDAIAPSGINPYVIILDGLDETLSSEEQLTILNVLSETVHHHNPSLRILICSRPEPIIATTFRSSASNLKNISATISLNDEVDSASDIRRFLVEKFRAIRDELPYPPSQEWPTPAEIDYLVAKSSGQFIFAATVEKYVCSPQHRHLAIKRLKHVLDLGLLEHINREKHPLADLDALYALILKTRNDVNASIKTMAFSFEYPKYFDTISPQQLAKVLGLDLAEAWSILYELASLLEVTQENIRPFHASFGDFLFDTSRCGDWYRSKEDIATDIACAMLTPHREPQDLPCTTFFYLLNAATPRQDLVGILSGMSPASIFSRPPGVRTSRGAYHLIPLLKLLENHVSPNVYPEIVSYFDQKFASLLPSGRVKENTFCEDSNHEPETVYQSKTSLGENVDQEADVEEDRDSDFEAPPLSLQSNGDDDDSGNSVAPDDDDERWQIQKAKGPEIPEYHVSQMAPLTAFPLWDEINAGSNIRLVGSDSLQGLCDEAHFTRTNLPATSAILLNETTQTKAALFCVHEMAKPNLPEDLYDAFAKLLPHSLAQLAHAERSEPLATAIINLMVHPIGRKQIPEVTIKGITGYLDSNRSQRLSKIPTTNTNSLNVPSLARVASLPSPPFPSPGPSSPNPSSAHLDETQASKGNKTNNIGREMNTWASKFFGKKRNTSRKR